MRKLLFTIILSMAVITASFHAQVKKLVIRERKTEKNINLIISTENNYSSQVYKHCDATISYVVVKVRGSITDTLEQKQFLPFKLKELSSFATSFHENISIKDVAERKEKIIIYYTVTYSSKGSMLSINHQKLVPKGAGVDSLSIHI